MVSIRLAAQGGVGTFQSEGLMGFSRTSHTSASMRTERTIGSPRGALLLTLSLLVISSPLTAQQDEGTTAAAIGGVALGGYSGATLGLVGSLVPCNRTLAGVRCPRIAAAVGGTVGMVGGGMIGANATDPLQYRLRGAGYGALIGGLVGYGLKRAVRQYEWVDLGAAAAIGAAVGATPVGAGIGFGSGAVVGTVLWLTLPDFEISDAIGVSLVGLAIGGLVDWVAGGVSAQDGPVQFVIPLQVRF